MKSPDLTSHELYVSKALTIVQDNCVRRYTSVSFFGHDNLWAELSYDLESNVCLYTQVAGDGSRPNWLLKLRHFADKAKHVVLLNDR